MLLVPLAATRRAGQLSEVLDRVLQQGMPKEGRAASLPMQAGSDAAEVIGTAKALINVLYVLQARLN
jgi:hypothetical protein